MKLKDEQSDTRACACTRSICMATWIVVSVFWESTVVKIKQMVLIPALHVGRIQYMLNSSAFSFKRHWPNQSAHPIYCFIHSTGVSQALPIHVTILDFRNLFFKRLYLFIYSWKTHTQRERERGRDTCKGRSRLHAGSPMWDSIPRLQDHALGLRLNPLSHPGCPVFGKFNKQQ